MRGVAEMLADVARVLPPPSGFDQATLALYVDGLSDVPLGVLDDACIAIMRTGMHFPRLAEVRRECAERMLMLPTGSEALQQVENRIRWARHNTGVVPPIHKLVLEVLDGVGGFYEFRTSEKPGMLRAQFLKLYDALRERAIRDAQVGSLLALPAGQGSSQVAKLSC